VAVLKEFDHPNVVKLLDVMYQYHQQQLSLVFEFVDLDLKVYMDNVKGLMEPLLVKSYMHQLLSAVHHCHSHGVLHRDLKPQNLLLDQNGGLKLADYGLARVFSVPMRCFTTGVVTRLYRAPELMLGSQRYSTGVDIWAAGCIFAEMVTGRVLFHGYTHIGQIYNIFQLLGTPTDHVWPGVEAMPLFTSEFPKWKPRNLRTHLQVSTEQLSDQGIDLLRKMLTYHPNKRISPAQALQHPYFKELHEQKTQQN
jgi:serine/threonine protein kinase